jgi:hypothetical protein
MQQWTGASGHVTRACGLPARDRRLGPRRATAQSNAAALAGIVRETQGGVLPGAVVTARHIETGIDTTRVADEQGRYYLPALRFGTYHVSAGTPGFRTLSHIDVRLVIGQTVTIDFALEPGGLAEAVTVTGRQPVLQSTNAEISDVLENREVVEFPLNGRNFLALAQLSDSVVIPPGGTRGDALQQAGPLPMSADNDPVTTSTCSTASK